MMAPHPANTSPNVPMPSATSAGASASMPAVVALPATRASRDASLGRLLQPPEGGHDTTLRLGLQHSPHLAQRLDMLVHVGESRFRRLDAQVRGPQRSPRLGAGAPLAFRAGGLEV